MITRSDPVVRLWLEQGTPIGPVSYQTKAYILRELGQLYGLRVIIETGSLDGKNMALLASEFSELHSIEIMPDYYELCCRELAQYPNVFMHLGDSAIELPRILELVEQPALIYLDAHCMGGESTKGPEYTPIRTELHAITKRKFRDIIVIDDVEEFHNNPEYPSESELLEIINDVMPEYKVAQIGNEYVLIHGALSYSAAFTRRSL